MKIGCCIGLDLVKKSSHNARAADLLSAGYSYVELPLAAATALSDSAFDELLSTIEQENIIVGACNIFLPGTVKLTGPDADHAVLTEYLGKALRRAARLGAEVLVVGSAGSRNVPEGFPRDRAWTQLVDAFRIISAESRPYELVVVVEPLNRAESNIINSLAEGARLVREIDRDNIGLLADFYHMAVENEEVCLEQYGDILWHTHFAEPEGRVFPREMKASYRAFFDGLRRIGYNGTVSMECGSDNLLADAIAALRVFTNYS